MKRGRKQSFKGATKLELLTRAFKTILSGLWVVFWILCIVAFHVGLVVEWLLLLPFRSVWFAWQFRWGRYWLIGMAIVATTVLIGLSLRAYINEREARLQAESEASALIAQLETEQVRNQLLLTKLDERQEVAGPQVPEGAKQYVISLIDRVFGSEAEKAKSVSKCESGFSPFNKHVNKDGSVDGGVFQINNKWHKARFENMFGVPFEIGVYVPELNVQYAKFLWDHSGPNPWVCSRIVGI